jgi:hypothetical protein
MNVNIFKMAVILLVLAGGFGSCGEKGEDNFSEPIEISFTEYSLVGTSGQWKNLESGKVIVINSNEELKKHFDCTNLDCPEIDFLKNTLLLASGGATNGIDRINACFMQSATSKYMLNMEVFLNDAMVAQSWHFALITEKIDKQSKIELNVTIIKI